MLQCVAQLCSKRRHVRFLCLLGTSCEVSPSAATGGTSECAGAFWARKHSEYLQYIEWSSFLIADRVSRAHRMVKFYNTRRSICSGTERFHSIACSIVAEIHRRFYDRFFKFPRTSTIERKRIERVENLDYFCTSVLHNYSYQGSSFSSLYFRIPKLQGIKMAQGFKRCAL